MLFNQHQLLGKTYAPATILTTYSMNVGEWVREPSSNFHSLTGSSFAVVSSRSGLSQRDQVLDSGRVHDQAETNIPAAPIACTLALRKPALEGSGSF